MQDAAADPLAPAASTLQPFAPGDVLVGATLLDNPDDDHAGRGRIVQYDRDLNLKGVLWTAGTTHLVYGLTLAPDGTLWAFDPWAWLVLRVSPDGRQLDNRRFAERAFSMVHFAPDGTLWFTESLKGEHQPEPLTTRHRPLPGHERLLGEGGLYQYTPDGELQRSWYPEVHGGRSGSMAVTHSVLAGDGHTLVYVSETGPRLMAFDLESGAQLPDLRSYPDDWSEMVFDLDRTPGGRLLVTMGRRIDIMDERGAELGSIPLPGFGWSLVTCAGSDSHCYAGNWFTGELVRVALDSGEITASTKLAGNCMAGLAGVPGGLL